MLDFNIKVDDENFSGKLSLSYNLISSDNTALQVDGSNLPKRDSFGRNIAKDLEQYCLGSNIINPMKSSQRYFSSYGSLFTSTIQQTRKQSQSNVDLIITTEMCLCQFSFS
jgi:hypothetical protein